MNPFQQAEEAIVADIRARGSTIAIIEPCGTRTSLEANIGQTEQPEDQAGQSQRLSTTATTVDFIVPVADLITREITRGHRIEFAGHTYRPVSRGNDPCSRPSGRFGLLLRIHTVQIQ